MPDSGAHDLDQARTGQGTPARSAPPAPGSAAGRTGPAAAATAPPAAGATASADQVRLGVAGLDRRTIALVASVVVVAWLVLVFGRAIAQSNQVSGEAAALRVQDAALAQQVADRQSELAVIQSPAFLALEARAYGYGTPHEQVFALQPGAPPPPSITPLGAAPSPAPPPTPLEAWLHLLLGN